MTWLNIWKILRQPPTFCIIMKKTHPPIFIHYSPILISINWFLSITTSFIYFHVLFYFFPLPLMLLFPQPWLQHRVIHGSTCVVRLPWGLEGGREPLSWGRRQSPWNFFRDRPFADLVWSFSRWVLFVFRSEKHYRLFNVSGWGLLMMVMVIWGSWSQSFMRIDLEIGNFMRTVIMVALLIKRTAIMIALLIKRTAFMIAVLIQTKK